MCTPLKSACILERDPSLDPIWLNFSKIAQTLCIKRTPRGTSLRDAKGKANQRPYMERLPYASDKMHLLAVPRGVWGVWMETSRTGVVTLDLLHVTKCYCVTSLDERAWHEYTTRKTYILIVPSPQISESLSRELGLWSACRRNLTHTHTHTDKF